MPFFSIITPSYNRAHIIGQAINSVLTQSFTDFEFIIVDDGSTDDTEKVVQAFGDTRIQYIKQENKGVCAARNTGIRNAKAPYITFLDSDDQALPNWLDDFYNTINLKTPDLVFCDMQVIDNQKNCKIRRAEYPYREDQYSDNGLYMPGSFCIAKHLLDKLGGFDENIRFGEFTELMFSCMNYTTVRLFTQKAGIIYYPSVDGGGKNQVNKINASLYLIQKHPQYFKNKPNVLLLYYQNIAVSHAQLKQWSKASGYFIKAYFVQPSNLKTLVRFFISLIPFLRDRVWPDFKSRT
ncbi:MAG: glycosyltransferase family 2 protein [Bacteroidetes bacterium]|nr:glycosyltransferase family 2 protein [Bacteroidota bacterium]